MITLTCKNCGKEFDIHPEHATATPSGYCSRACKAAANARMITCGSMLYLGLGEEERCGEPAVAIVDQGEPHAHAVCAECRELCHPTRLSPLFNQETIMTLGEIYDSLPLTERTLLKHYKSYPFKIANDRGEPCLWFLYDVEDVPAGAVRYYRGRKLCSYGIVKLKEECHD